MSTIDKLIRRQIKLTILSVIAVVLITSTITYALYQTNHENTTDQVISIGNLGLTATGTPITLEGLYPMEEYDLTSSYPSYNFTLENKTNNVNNDYTLMYELVLRADENTTLTQDDYQYIMYKIDGSDAKALSEVWDSEINGFKILDGRLLSHEETTLSTDLANKDLETHSIVFWLSTYAPNSVQGKVLTLKMSLEAYADRFNYLKYYAYADNNVFGKALNRSDFESITILDRIEIPDSALDSWDVSNKQNKSIMAWYTDDDNNGLYELYIGQFGGVVANPDCSALYQGYTSLTNIDLSKFDTSFVTNMSSMFRILSKLNSLNLNNLSTINVTNMSWMFYNTGSFNLDLNNFNTSYVINMSYMFAESYNIPEIKFGKNFDTSNVINMSYMFMNTFKIENLDLSSFDTSKVINMIYMFGGMQKLKVLNISNMTFESMSNQSIFVSNSGSKISSYTKIITNECAEEFIRDRLIDANISTITLEIVPCVKVCYSYNINNVPSEYTELSYIESTGTQYIDSEYKPTPNTGVYADFQYTDRGYSQYLFGVTSNISINNTISYGFYKNSYGSYSYTYQNNYGNWINTGKAIDNIRHKLEFNIENNKTIKIDDGLFYNSAISGNATNTSPYNMMIMANNNLDNNTITAKASVKLYSFKIYENGTLVRNYVPALRNSDNAIGLYETEEGRFYENSGTGVFNSNGGMQIKTGNTIQLISTISARPGYTFVGWNTKPGGTGTTFKQGEEVNIEVIKSLGEDTITLYAMWEANN